MYAALPDIQERRISKTDLLLESNLYPPMAEYCSQCSPYKAEHDHDLLALALQLPAGHSTSFLCEGCANRAIYRDEEDRIYLAKQLGEELKCTEVNLVEI